MSRRALTRFACSLVALALALAPGAFAQTREREPPRRSGPGTGNPDEHLVPWRFLQSDVLPKDRPITLYWIASSAEETERSPLMTAESLRVAATRCVDLEIALPERVAKIPLLRDAGKAPMALLVDREGKIVRQSASSPQAVQRMLADELAARDDKMYRQMSEATRQANVGNAAAAIELYKQIWSDRCLFPLAGTAAQHALKDLGVIVKDIPAPPPVDPNMQKPEPKT